MNLSRRYVTSRQLPDKAIDLMGRSLGPGQGAAPDSADPHRRASATDQELDAEIAAEPETQDEPAHPPASRRRVRDQVADELRDERAAWEAEVGTERPVITPHEIAEVLSAWIGVPLPTLAENDSDRFLHMEDDLRKRVVGQDDVLTELGPRPTPRPGRHARLAPTHRIVPLPGESGVGKTETAKALAQFVSGTDDNLVRVDMSEMSEYHSISRLIGSPPGYVGFDEAGGLTEAVRRNPYSVVLSTTWRKPTPNVACSAADHGRRPAHGCQRPPRRLPQHHRRADLEPGRRPGHRTLHRFRTDLGVRPGAIPLTKPASASTPASNYPANS